MKAQFISKLLTQPWHMQDARARMIMGQIITKLLKNDRPDEDSWGNALPVMQILGNIAMIPITGTIDINVPDWIKEWGFNLTDANDIEDEVNQALANPQVTLIVADVDSGGGSADGGDKLFSVFEAANQIKPVLGWCGDGAMACSSAFEAIAPATAILTGAFAQIGCIGTYWAVLDDTKFWEQMGLTWNVFRSGDLKGIGENGISEEQAEWLQSVVDMYGARFRANVSKYRTGIAAEDMEGQWFRGEDAAARGFSAGLARNRDEAIAKFSRMIL